MKIQNAFMLLLLSCIAASCTQHDYHEWVAKRTIRHYLLTKPIDRYRPLAFSSLDSAFTSVKDVPDGQTPLRPCPPGFTGHTTWNRNRKPPTARKPTAHNMCATR